METVIQGDSLGLNRRDNLPSKTTPLVDSHTFSGHNLLKPRVNQVTGCCATKVVINLSTSLVIPDYNKFFDGSPATFQPSYYQLDDGSLVTPPFAEDITGGSVNLLVLGILVAIFARNIAVSGDYIRRGKVKSKSLFYVLFASQILAPVSLLPMIASYFNQTINCTAVVIVSYLSSNISLAFLITGILGVKAYKCLNNSRLVLAVLTLMQLASFGATIRDVTMTSGERRLSGSCIRKAGDPISVLIFVVIQFVESLFICCCFLFAYWKSRGSRTAKGRISLPASLAESPISPVSDEKAEGKKLRLKPRGWWDYVPNAQLSPRTQQASTRQPEPLHQAVRSKISGFISKRRNKKFTVPIKPKQQKRESIASDAGKLLNRQSLAASIHYTARPNSPTPSSFSRISKLIPNMVLFRKVMTDELLYTAFITATCVVVAVLVIIGVNFKNNLTVTGWVGTNWAIISLLTIHSFGRVVRRHEREALVQRCSDTSRTMRDKIGRAKRRTSSPQIRFRNDVPYSNQEDPFADVHGLRGPMTSWDSSVVSPSEPLPTDFPSDRRESTTSQATSNSSFLSTDKPLISSAASSDIRSPFSETWLIDARSRDNLIEENISDTTRNGHGSQ